MISSEHHSEFNAGQIFRRFGQKFCDTKPLPLHHRQAIYDISQCRTAHLGGHIQICKSCKHETPCYNSCGNSYCPMCQGKRRKKWLQSRLQDLLPVPYFHCVFTLPHEYNEIALLNPKLIYGALFRSAADSILHFFKKHHNSKPAIIATLHTWGQNLCLHPHVHLLISGGGLDANGKWVSTQSDYLFDVKKLSGYFKECFVKKISKASFQEKLTKNKHYEKNCSEAENKKWVVNIKGYVKGPEKVLEYLSRYVFRAAIANSRIKGVSQSGISFDYKDYKDTDKNKIPKHKIMKLAPMEFLQRFMLHILPKGIKRSRFYGILAGSREEIEKCKQIFADLIQKLQENKDEEDLPNKPECPKCGCHEFSKGQEIKKERPPPVKVHWIRSKLPA